MMPDFQNYHTYRDVDVLKKWARGRNAADPKLWPKNAERLLAGKVAEAVKHTVLPLEQRCLSRTR
jgi:hypothetical protein